MKKSYFLFCLMYLSGSLCATSSSFFESSYKKYISNFDLDRLRFERSSNSFDSFVAPFFLRISFALTESRLFYFKMCNSRISILDDRIKELERKEEDLKVLDSLKRLKNKGIVFDYDNMDFKNDKDKKQEKVDISSAKYVVLAYPFLAGFDAKDKNNFPGRNECLTL